MKKPNEIYNWLKANCGKNVLGGLTSHDADALLASIAMLPLINYSGAPDHLFSGYHAIVMEMQHNLRWMAYHAIAMELDWGHREMIWHRAGLPVEDKPRFKAAFEPGGSRIEFQP